MITTVGLEAMPLIRYRTGDYTRILPPCPCGGVTRRLDTVSRKEGEISIEQLDAVLFGMEQVLDYKARYDGTLHIEMSLLESMDVGGLKDAVARIYPGLKTEFELKPFDFAARPMYLGKRCIMA